MSDLKRRLRVWWRMLNHTDVTNPDFFLRYDHMKTRERWQKSHAMWLRRDYVRRMSGGYPTGEQP